MRQSQSRRMGAKKSKSKVASEASSKGNTGRGRSQKKTVPTRGTKQQEDTNVRVGPNHSLPSPRVPQSMIQQPPTELPTTLEGDAEAAFDHFDRKAFKANVAHNHKMLSNTTTSATATATATAASQGRAEISSDEADAEGEQKQQPPLRTSPKRYGDASQNKRGYYSAQITVKDWCFDHTELTVPLGCVLVFGVDKKERSMVEVTVNITHDTDAGLAKQSPCLTAGSQWEYFCNGLGEFEFQDSNDEDDAMQGSFVVVEGDEMTQNAKVAAQKYQETKDMEVRQKQKKQDKKEQDAFEHELLEMNKTVNENKEINQEVQETLHRAASPTQPTTGGEVMTDLDAARQQAVADSLAIYQQMKRR